MNALFRLESKKKAIKFIETVDTTRKGKIGEAILILKQNPVPIGQIDLAKLKGYDNLYRIRIGKIRIIYEVFWRERRILIHYIGPRRKAYDAL